MSELGADVREGQFCACDEERLHGPMGVPMGVPMKPVEPTLRKEDPFCEADLPENTSSGGFAFPLPGLLKRTGIEITPPRDTREGESRRLCSGWEFWPSSKALATIHRSPEDHVTVTCHCSRCEAERRLGEHVESLVGGYVETVGGAGEVCGRLDRSRPPQERED